MSNLQNRVAGGSGLAERQKGNAESFIGDALSIPLMILVGLCDVLIAKGTLSREEMLSILQPIFDRISQGENEAMMKMMLSPVLARYQDKAGPGSDH